MHIFWLPLPSVGEELWREGGGEEREPPIEFVSQPTVQQVSRTATHTYSLCVTCVWEGCATLLLTIHSGETFVVAFG